MNTCTNCGNKYGCSCKTRTASDGKQCCSLCIVNYEELLKKKK